MSEETTLWLARGRAVDLEDLRPCDVRLTDIATSLERQCRFVGHADWSVASHSVLVAEAVRRIGGWEPIYRLWALLHDAHETYVGDVARPVLSLLGESFVGLVESVKQRIDVSVMAAVGLQGVPASVVDLVHRADDITLLAEREAFFNVAADLSAFTYSASRAFFAVEDGMRRGYTSGSWLKAVRACIEEMRQRGELDDPLGEC